MGFFSSSKKPVQEEPRKEEPSETVLQLADVQVYQVEDRRATLLDQGPLLLTAAGSALTATVNNSTHWELHPTQPVLKNATFSYTFAVKGGGVFYQLLLAHGTPQSEAALLEEILSQCTAYEVYQGAGCISKEQAEKVVSHVEQELIAEGPIEPATSTEALPASHAERITAGAATVAASIASGAASLAGKMQASSEAIKTRIAPATKAVPVPFFIKGPVKAARKAAWAGARGASVVSSKSTDIVMRVADTIVRRLGGGVFGHYLNSGGSDRSKAARDIAAASLVAASQIYDSMEEAAMLVLNSAKESSTSVITHKYGPAAGELARDATAAGMGTIVGAVRLKGLTPVGGVQSLATRIARRTSKGLVLAAVKAAKDAQDEKLALTAGGASSSAAEGPYALLAQKQADAAAQKGVQAIKQR